MELENQHAEDYEESIEFEDQEIENYASGFNAAAILFESAPDLLKDIERSMNPINDFYYDGFFAGKDYYERELVRTNQLNELGELRNKSKDRENEIER